MSTKSSGFWIPRELFLNKDLTMIEKFLLVEIQSLSMLDNGCIASNQHFADLLGVRKTNISRALNAMQAKGYITIELKDRNHSRVIKLISGGYQIDIGGLSKRLQSKGNNTINNTNKNIYSDLFLEAWKRYGCKGSKVNAFVQWQKLDDLQHQEAITAIEFYFLEQPDPKYHKHFERYLSHKVFESVLERKDAGQLNIPTDKSDPFAEFQHLFDEVHKK